MCSMNSLKYPPGQNYPDDKISHYPGSRQVKYTKAPVQGPKKKMNLSSGLGWWGFGWGVIKVASMHPP